MHLTLFDIDGTLMDSVQTDDACFIQTFGELYGMELGEVDWNGFPHVTDAGLTEALFVRAFERGASAEEVAEVKERFEALLRARKEEFIAVKGALDFLKELVARPDVELGFATGGWAETAMLKCQTVGLDLGAYLHRTSNDHFDRAEITRMVMQDAMERHGEHAFSRITYFGDGLWDYRTTQSLGIDFVGVDIHGNGKLNAAGAEHVLRDFSDPERLLEVLNLRGS